MIARIKEIATYYGLSSTAFADRIDVARPVISHILSERNRPSLEVVQKIGVAFPAISTDWLLYGKGSMLKNLAEALASTREEESQEKPQINEDNIQADLPLNKINPDSGNDHFSEIVPSAVTRKIKKVLIFYSDHTFEEFNPSA